MKLRRWTKIISVILIDISMMALVACSAHHKKPQDPNAVNEANAAYNASAQASGLGTETSFGDQAGGKALANSSSSKRIYYFDFDSNIVHDQDKPSIEANANYLLSHPRMKVMLEGHTDPRGSREYNIGLGERRAKSVAQILTARGVNPAQIRVVSYGAEKLASAGRSEADYQQDRRAVVLYLR